MREDQRYCEVISMPTFEAGARKLFSESDRRDLEVGLAENPEAGTVIPRTGGVRKLRVALPGGGRSGGARVIYYFLNHEEQVFLLVAYRKSKQETLREADKAALRVLVKDLKRGGRP